MYGQCLCSYNYGGRYCQFLLCHPPAVKNSVLVHKGSIGYKIGSGYTEGTVISYFCKEGFWVAGVNFLTCTSTGKFDRDPPLCVEYRPKNETVCKNEYSSFYAQEQKEVQKQAIYEKKIQYSVGTKLIFSCPYGTNFKDTGGQTQMVVTCKKDGTWSQKWKYCQGMFCERPLLTNGVVTPVYRLLFTPTTVIQYSCRIGYYLWGKEKSTCQKSGQWSPTLPQCITLNVFRNRCIINNQKLKFRQSTQYPNERVPYCYQAMTASDTAAQAQIKTITIVTAIAVAIFGVLLIIVAVVAFQRRQILRQIRRARIEAEMAENDPSESYQDGFINFLLPSYDEALRSKPTTAPPSFEESMQAVAMQRNEGDSNMAAPSVAESLCNNLNSQNLYQEQVSGDEDDIVVPRNRNELIFSNESTSSVSSVDSYLITNNSEVVNLV